MSKLASRRIVEQDPTLRRARIEWAQRVVQQMVDAPLAIGTTLAKLQLLCLVKPRNQ